MGTGYLKESGCGHVTVPMAVSVPQQVYLWRDCSLRGSPWSPLGGEVLENVHLEASVAVHEDMLEHVKVCGYRWAHDRVGTRLDGLQLWVSHVGAPLLFLQGQGHTGTRCTSKWLWLWLSLCRNRYTPVLTLAHRQTLADNGENTITCSTHAHTESSNYFMNFRASFNLKRSPKNFI